MKLIGILFTVIVIPRIWVSNLEDLSQAIRSAGYNIEVRRRNNETVQIKIKETLTQSERNALRTLIKSRADVLNDVKFR